MNRDYKLYIIFAVIFLAAISIGGRLVQLQIVEQKEYGSASDKNSIKKITESPARGLMLDRMGKVVVDNRPSYTLTITPFQFNKNLTEEIAALVGIEADDLRSELSKAKGTNRFNPVKIKRDLDFKTVAFIEENRDRLRGVSYQVESLRSYPVKYRASHIFGYNSEISEKQLSESTENFYRQGDLVGTTGLEKYYEKQLRGEKGSKLISVDVNGKEVGAYNEGKNDIKSVNGSDLHTSLDSDLQEYAEKLLGKRRGAIIAVDPRTGEILCMVSKPDFDLNVFSGTPDTKEIAKLFNDVDKPVFNRVTQTRYPPGSTWKMMMALAGLGSGKITTTSTISCGGSYTFGNRTYEDHGSYGSIGISRALEVSSNVFFYKMGVMLGIKDYHDYSEMFGFGNRTGIDLPSETRGLLPSEDYFNKVYGVNKWGQGLMVSLGIGQGELGVSPVQMVGYVSAICMNGQYNVPHIVRETYNSTTDLKTLVELKNHKIDFPQKYFDVVKKGMYLVVNGSGTAKNVKNSEYVLSGKTGTAQTTKGNNHSWFVGFAPYDEPKIAICVLGENAGWGAQFAAPIAAAIMVRFLSGNTVDAYNENAGTEARD
ncbi:MAG: penicillin-binding protein 2 [Ignavibacteriae bacterium]|nr:penicillin-binding protein 2 [Ignavibacteriota bacterium]